MRFEPLLRGSADALAPFGDFYREHEKVRGRGFRGGVFAGQGEFPEEATVYEGPIGKEGRLSMEILDDWEAIEEMEMKQLDSLNGPIRD